MRLLTKTTLYFLTALVPLLLAAGIILYYHFNREFNHRMDQELLAEEFQWLRYLRKQAATGTTYILRTPEIVISPVNATPSKFPSLETTSGSDENGSSNVRYRQLTHVVSVAGIPYLITIRKSQEHRAALVRNITRIMFIVFIGFFLLTLLINWWISKSIWTPFRRSLNKINEAELQKMEAMHFDESNVKEFNELNTALNMMTKKLHSDYVNIKEFTENAAHEMQTPLAVVQSKMELLIQDKDLTDEQVNSIIQATEALSRLSKLNESLLLLTKIENNQYVTDELISITSVTKKYLELFDEFIKDKQITVGEEYEGDWLIKLHPLLADSLVSNLVGNAVKYNYTGGKISVIISDKKIQVSNTSNLPPIDPELLFKRFNKNNTISDNSTGLGLAIVKKICDTYGLNIKYHAKEGLHSFTVEKA